MTILSHFRGIPREQQEYALSELEASWDSNDVFVIDAPVACGKSKIAGCIADWNDYKTTILTPTNILVDQYQDDFEDYAYLRKKSMYPCDFDHKQCRNNLKDCKDCPYKKARSRIHIAQTGVMNYYMYLSLRKHFRYRTSNLIIDECFPKETILNTDKGSRTIRSIYNRHVRGEQLNVLSYNEQTETFEYKRVLNATEKLCEKPSVGVKLDNKATIKCTTDHRILTTDGYKKANKLCKGDRIISWSDDSVGLLVPNTDTKQVIIGSILGDGYWRRDKTVRSGKRLSIRHGLKQKDYMEFKAAILGSTAKINGCSGYTKEEQLDCTTRYIDDIGIEDKQQALNLIDQSGLAIWFCDDGSLARQKGNIVGARFHTESWDIKDVEHAVFTLKEKFNIDADIRYYKNNYPYISIRKEPALRLVAEIYKFVPKCMAYKVNNGSCGQYNWQLSGYKQYRTSVVREVTSLVSPEYVYDIEVEDNHNFVVKYHRNSKAGIVAHNCHNLIPMLTDLAAIKLWKKKYKYPHNLRTEEDILKWLYDSKLDKRKQLKPVVASMLSDSPDYRFERTTELYYGREEELLKIRPISVRNYNPVMWPKFVNKIVLMSATISYKDIEELGLDKKRVKYIQTSSPIPPSNRPVVYYPLGSMAHRNMDDNMPALAEFLRNILTKYRSKGIVHLTYSMMNKLKPLLLGSDRLIWHDRFDARDKYREFRRRSDNCVLMACGLQEGVDIANDFGRWQIITKVPYPSLVDAAINIKASSDPDWYKWQTIKTILQASGRICRHPEDFGTTIITDSAFENLYQRNQHLFPQWFKQALVVR